MADIGTVRQKCIFTTHTPVSAGHDQFPLDAVGRVQLLCSGKAHPREQDGKILIQQIFKMREILKDDVPVVFLADYDLDVAKRMTAGVDLWLNPPQPPLEASGTVA